MNYSNLMDAVNARIKANGRREITGDILNDVLRAMVVELGAGYQLGGTIRPGDKPKDEDLRVAYLAVEPGMYLYAGGFEVTELSLITYGAEWYMYPLGVPFGSQIAEDIAAAVEAENTRAMAAEKVLSDAIATEESERKAADTALGTRLTSIEDKIPAQASSENKLADKDFVNSSIATSTATFRGTFETLEALKAAQADKNDYAFWVHKDEDGNTCYDKYTYTGTEWKFEYRLNNSSFTAAQWAALNSGVTADIIKALQDADKANAKAIADEKAERIAAISAEQQAREQADTTLQGNIDKKQDTISDLATIRTNAAHGQTAFGWGDHAKAGYTKAFIINLSGDGSTENLYTVDKTREEVAAALAANSLILLKGGADGFSEIYPLNWATNYPTQALMLQFGNIDEASLIYTTMVLVFSYQEGAGVNVMASSIKLATDEQVKAKQDKLVSGTNIKTFNGESILGAGDLKVSGGLSTIKAGDGANSEVFNGLAPRNAASERSHAEGNGSVSYNSEYAHAEGQGYVSSNAPSAHAEGNGTASGSLSHAEGRYTQSNGYASHAEGNETTAQRDYSHAEGTLNVKDSDAIHQVGIGISASKDAHRITYDGKHYIIGIGGFDGTKATANFTNEKDLATVINGYETRIAALEKALAGIKSN